MAKYEFLTLKRLVNTKLKKDKNETIIDFNDMILSSADVFSNIYGGICIMPEGILYEESLESLLMLSDIKYQVLEGGEYMHFIQSDIAYTAEIYEHGDSMVIDFNTLSVYDNEYIVNEDTGAMTPDNGTRKHIKRVSVDMVIDVTLLEDQLDYLYSADGLTIEDANLVDGIISMLEKIRDTCGEE